MGNLIGEGFNKVIKQQIDTRQKVYGSVQRTTDQLRYMNSRSAWIRMSSAADIDSSRAALLNSAGVANVPLGGDLAKKYILSGGTSFFNSQGNLEFYKGLDGYTVGGFSQGYRPQPGITSFDTKNRNRGAIRESNIKVKCYNREQFQILDTLYLRLGYSVLIEWGHSIYLNNDGTISEMQESDTLTSNFLNNEYNNDHSKLQKAINDQKIKLQGNYDATFGRITNFSWDYLPDGTYDINITILSWGDIIESLKMNTQASDENQQQLTPEEEQEEQEKLESAETEEDILKYGRNKHNISLLFYKIYDTLITNGVSSGKMSTISDEKAKELGLSSGKDVVYFNEQSSDNDMFYIRLGGFLEYIKTHALIYNKGYNQTAESAQTAGIINIDNDEETNLIFTTPYVLSADPRICIVKALIATSNQDFDIFKELPKDFKIDAFGDNSLILGKLMNVYVNMTFILRMMDESKGEDGKSVYNDLIEKILSGLNSSLGNINKLTTTIDESDNNRVYIIDETQIPNIDKVIKKFAPEASTEKNVFEVYGFKTGSASFVTNFGIKTEITKELSTMMTVGAQANGQAVGEDATAFSRWNEGIIDRIIPEKNSADITKDKEAKETKYKNIEEEFGNFAIQIQDYNFGESIDSFSDILNNYLTYQQARKSSTEKKQSTTIGFIPINLNLEIVGLSGIKIYQKFSITQEFLPSNYNQTLNFLVKGISHKIEGNKWITSIESLSIPSQGTTAASRKFPYVAPPPNPTLPTTPLPSDPAASGADLQSAQNGLSGISGGKCGKKELNFKWPATVDPEGDKRKKALQLSYDATFKNGQYKSGMCAKYTYNHAYNFTKAILGGKLAYGGVLSAGGNANQSTYFANLIKLGYQMYVVGKNITKAELVDLIDNKLSYNLGDVLSYWANDNPKDGSASQYGHTQLYIGSNAIKEQKDSKPPKGWTTDRFTNYGSTFVYGSKKYNCWNLILFRAPYDSISPSGVDQSASRQLYQDYVNIIGKILRLEDKEFRSDSASLLQPYVGRISDNVTQATKIIQSVFGINYPSYGNTIYNKYPISKLSPEHQKVFKDQMNKLVAEIISKTNYYDYLLPSVKFPDKADQNSFVTVKSDY